MLVKVIPGSSSSVALMACASSIVCRGPESSEPLPLDLRTGRERRRAGEWHLLERQDRFAPADPLGKKREPFAQPRGS